MSIINFSYYGEHLKIFASVLEIKLCRLSLLWVQTGVMKAKAASLTFGRASFCEHSFQGGNNAGHTVVNDLGTFKLHQLPSGVFNPDCLAVLGPGMVISPALLSQEIAEVEEAGVK